MLANYDVRDKIVSTTRLNSEIRFLPSYLITDMSILIYKNKVTMIIFTKDPVVFQLESKEARDSFIKYFDAFWKIAKK